MTVTVSVCASPLIPLSVTPLNSVFIPVFMNFLPLPYCQSHTHVLPLNSRLSPNSASRWDPCFTVGVPPTPHPPTGFKQKWGRDVRGDLLTVTNTHRHARTHPNTQGSTTMTVWECLWGTSDCDQGHGMVHSWLTDLKGSYGLLGLNNSVT